MKKNFIHPSTLKFLKGLEANNNREWFNAHKSSYLEAQQNMGSFVDGVISLMNKHDLLENTSGKQSLFRIYKDVRFSKDKLPYNPRFAFSLKRATRLRRGGYYMNTQPGRAVLAAGFFNPNPADLKRIREDIVYNFEEWNRILSLKAIRNNFGALAGDKVATVPRGFSKDHPAIDLLRHKQFIFRHEFTDKEIISEKFPEEVNRLFKSIRPFFDYMSEVLTTNVNGEPV